MSAVLLAAQLALAPAVVRAQGAPLPLAGAGYQPSDKVERGLWMVVDEQERFYKTSNFVIHDPALNDYVRKVLCRTVGEEECKSVRIYIMRTPFFNASMAPNGMMEVWSGLLLRLQNEAQLAAILGHEYAHYKHRHSVQLFRDAREKANAASWLSMFGIAGQVVALGVLSSYFTFSREMEAQSDTESVKYMAASGYAPMSASRIWEQLRTEMDATAAARQRKSKKDKDKSIFATHPPSAERMAVLRRQAETISAVGNDEKRAEYRSVMAPLWASFIDDQIKLNDFGGTEFLLGLLAKDGWSGPLLYARGELYRSRGKPEDLVQAAQFFAQASTMPDAPVETWRGLGLSLLRSGKAEEGRLALRQYLTRQPDAADAAMIKMLSGVS